MTWNIKTKILQQEASDEIQTPDGDQILVGANEDDVLVSYEGFNNWGQNDKTDAVGQTKSKIPQQYYRRRILTPDYRQILVGASENLILIAHGASSNWDLKTKIPA